MLHKVKEIFQKLFPSKEVTQPTFTEAPYKVEPDLKSSAPVTSEVEVAEQPAKTTKPKKPRTNQNGNKPKQRKNK